MLNYKIIYSNRKTLCIEIKNNEALVRAPRYCAKSVIERFVSRHEAWALKKLEQQAGCERFIRCQMNEGELVLLKNRAAQEIIPRAGQLSRQCGLNASGFGITGARTRFGSCSPKNKVNFSCFLALYPQSCVDYVIIHELCHTVHKNHSAEFYALVRSLMPEYKEMQKLLREL